MMTQKKMQEKTFLIITKDKYVTELEKKNNRRVMLRRVKIFFLLLKINIINAL